MNGFPKKIATQHDVKVLLITHPEETKAYLKTCLDEVMQWYPCDMLELEDDHHKIVEIEGTDIQPTIRQQYELRVDTNCALFRLGYSIENVNQMIENEI